MEITTQLKGVREALHTLKLVDRDAGRATDRALTAIGLLVQREARRNAPRSPKRSQLNRARKTTRRTKRNARAHSGPNPGGLIRSITSKTQNDGVHVFVSGNAEAGKYAHRIHELKHKPGGWTRRGLGTQSRGSRADDKFITRAITDNEGNILKIIKQEHRKAGWYEL